MSISLEEAASLDSKIHGANVGPTWDRKDPGGPHVGHMNPAILVNINLKMPFY